VVFRKTLTAYTGENSLIALMKEVPMEVELSSLPKIKGDKREVVLSIASNYEELTNEVFKKFEHYLQQQQIAYTLGEE
jgi:hypothetical protein